MKLLLFAVIGLCVVNAIVADSEELGELEEELLRRVVAAKADAAKTANTKGKLDAVQAAIGAQQPELSEEQTQSNAREEKNADALNSCSSSLEVIEATAEAEQKAGLKEKLKQEKPCCTPGTATIDLSKSKIGKPNVNGIQLQQYYGGGWWSPAKKCGSMALLKVTFEKPDSCEKGCVKKPQCGRTMLKIELELSTGDRTGHLLNIGDSVSNNGWGGDYGHQSCDAELHGYNSYMIAYKSDKCKWHGYDSSVFSQILKRNTKITLYVSNEFIRIKEGNGQEHTLCSHCLFCLADQPDTNQNKDIYIGLNRVVHGTYRNGKGICSAKLSWECCDW